MMTHLPATIASLAIALSSAAVAVGNVVNVSGVIENPTKVHGNTASFQLAGDTTFGWRTGRVTGDLDVAGHRFTMNTGGGNTIRLAGSITGTGEIIWQGGGPGPSQRRPSFLEGDRANTFTGMFVLERGLLVLAKPAGVNAIAGPLTLGGANWAGIRWKASNQVADGTEVTFTGKHTSTFEMNGASETLGTLTLDGDGEIILSDGDSLLRFTNSSASVWHADAQLIIHDWDGSDASSGDHVYFGDSNDGLTDQQVAQLGFVDPAGRAPGLYRARILDTGELTPGEAVEPVNPPYDLSPEAQTRREEVYTTDGLEKLAATARSLKDPVKIDFFGDSITWLGGYLKVLGSAVKPGDGQAAPIVLIKRGINGGGAKHLRDGAGGLFKQDQPALVDVLEEDRPDIAVFFIGVNDVNVFNTDADEFRATMKQLIQAALDRDITPIVATLMLVHEKPDGSNAKDKRLDEFAAITLDVAEQAGVAAVDLRSISIAYLKNQNYEVRLDGSLDHRPYGLLTNDGVHPSAEGNRLIAGHLANAIAGAMKPGNPPDPD